ncbi:hypothetical protein P4H42_24105 [Paenibacillus macerans]|uniref:hypothetical protein n=1 Tax=Paenibacillus macerans TaxID=44252 RepID=UPI002DB682A8|nr:hypothetical protein [Paenibacillus macerans]MEC0332671.1 hypothetical protein [Paenibacillus macerans]
MEQRLMDQLNEWYEADEHQRIVDTLSAIPNEERDYEAISHLARAICTRIVEAKGGFSFHADELSYVMYDVQFWLYTKSYPDTRHDQYVAAYENITAFGKEFGQGGYAPSFITDWLDVRMKEGRIVQDHGMIRFTDSYAAEVIEKLNEA